MLRAVSQNFRFKPSLKRIISRHTATYNFQYYGEPDGPNFYLVQYLTLEYQKYEALRKSLNCTRVMDAIKSINSLDYAVQPEDVLTDIAGVDQEIATMILSFFGKIKKTDFIRLHAGGRTFTPGENLVKTVVLNQLQTVNGIGPIKALMLYNDGCRSIAQLKDPRFFNTLPKHIQELIVNEKELNSEVLYAQAISCKNSLASVIDNQFDIQVVGNFSLKKHEIDLLLFHPDYDRPPLVRKRRFVDFQPLCFPQPPTSLLHAAVLAPLQKKGILLSTTFGSPDRWHGVIKIEHNGEHLFRKANIFFMPTVAKSIALRLYTEPSDSVHRYFLKALKQNLHLNDYGLWRSTDDPSVNKRLESKYSNLYYSLAKANAMIKFLSRSSSRENPTVISDEENGLSSSPSHDLFYERLATSDEEAFFNAIYMEPSGSSTRSSSTLKETVQLPTSEAWNISQCPPHMYPHLSFFRNFIKRNIDAQQGNDSSSFKHRFSRQTPSYSKRGESYQAGSRFNRPKAGPHYRPSGGAHSH